MVNIKGGKKHKKYAKNRDSGNKRKIELKEDGERYARVIKANGNNRFQLECFEENGIINRLGILRGKMRKRVWIKPNDYVLVSMRGYQEDKCDIIHKYNEDEVAKLIRNKAINVLANKSNDILFSFDNDEDNGDNGGGNTQKHDSSTENDKKGDDLTFDFDDI